MYGDKWLPGIVVEWTGPLSFKVKTVTHGIVRRHQDQIRTSVHHYTERLVPDPPVREEEFVIPQENRSTVYDSFPRFKDGSGDPSGFKDMLRRHNIPVGTFVRYVGNRMHVLFHLAGVIVLHRGKVKEFLETRCTADYRIDMSAAFDTIDRDILLQIVKDIVEEDELRLIQFLLSNTHINTRINNADINAPFTSNVGTLNFFSKSLVQHAVTKRSTIATVVSNQRTNQYSDQLSRPLVKINEQQLQFWLSERDLLMLPTTNAFGEPLSPDNDDVPSELLCFVSGEGVIQQESLQSIGSGLSGHTAFTARSLSQRARAITRHGMLQNALCAPTHYMASERALGCLDKMFRRAPVATGGF
ncbi:hypothetical protein EGW08_013035 [Elysia chlorotica]|uniref:Uncharacterized protein n=1 Tax=Elysia chlorotica TaxID=188477 RepID=A0A3S1BZX2_ELYCH|nr:hypothetical protein EGW08_013035 [Elysia chlorotica]